MHEASIAESILAQAVKAAPGPDVRITRISLVAGPFAGVEQESLKFYFEELRKGTQASAAVLEMASRPAKLICNACGYSQDYHAGHDLKTICPTCSGPLKLTGSDEFYIDSIEIEEE